MIVLVEGPDGTGKTTIADVFVNKYGFYYKHLGPCDDIEKAYCGLIRELDIMKDNNINVVIDRAILSNKVYSDVFGGAVLSDNKYKRMKALIDCTVLCLPQSKQEYINFFNRLKNTREELYTTDVEKVYDLFNKYKYESDFLYDMFREDSKEYVDRIIQSNR